MKKIINISNAPQPIGPYNQAVKKGNTLFVSGQIPIVPQTGELITGDIKPQTIQVMENLKALLTEAAMTFDNVVKASIFLSDMNNFAAVNEIYGSYFTGDYPARETVQVAGLPKNVDVEISLIAMD
ncbi:MAG: RidA family protein [Bacteroidota bacterium]|jgi:2-iminobutanoate/2-iminopropanoate deaminase